MDIESMRTFLAVARHRSISRAAQELYATQPTVSLRIKRIEQELGFPVLLRSWKGVDLTPEGRHILPTIAEYLFRLQTAKRMTQEALTHSGVSSIMDAHAMSETVGVDEWLVGAGTTRLIAALDHIPEAHLRVTNSAKLHSMVAHGICTRGVTYSDGISKSWGNHETLLWSEPLALVHPTTDDGVAEPSVDALRHYFTTRTFLLMDDPVFTDHSGVTGPLLEDLMPRNTRVVDHVDIMAALCLKSGNATLIPAGVCQRRPAFNQPGITWTTMDYPWGPVSVVLVENDFEQLDARGEAHEAIMAWADQEHAQHTAIGPR
ncbi:LysR family transcriptional regulator [Enteractinococcus coprophilus]|uniref:DNA-binding transcriptional LysR family regulator n=1 Tax=Enteractinococcus coprophilus TaxID=1027633 RepID=A0A543ANJ2_9MICC|nr:LysR family transcriptional regulator [Enteractinococcus coprophilus]TQL74138.1 DNA-binding transcriptional LysR family regulator [Enteractinococcus coprophilus]